MIENQDYQLIPGDKESWNIRFLKGPFIETVISFGKLEIKEDSDLLSFNIEVEYTPDDTITVKNTELQEASGEVLKSILTNILEKETKA